jgi:hypothetical protein
LHRPHAIPALRPGRKIQKAGSRRCHVLPKYYPSITQKTDAGPRLCEGRDLRMSGSTAHCTQSPNIQPYSAARHAALPVSAPNTSLLKNTILPQFFAPRVSAKHVYAFAFFGPTPAPP